MIELNCIKSLNGANGKFDLDVNLNVKKGEFVDKSRRSDAF